MFQVSLVLKRLVGESKPKEHRFWIVRIFVKEIFIRREETSDPHKIRKSLCTERTTTTTSRNVMID